MAKDHQNQSTPSENESARTENQAASTTNSTVIKDDGGIQAKAPVTPDVEEQSDVEIDTFDVFEIAGIKYVIGLGLDNRMYNWNVRTGKWQLFVIQENNSMPGGSTVDPMDDIL